MSLDLSMTDRVYLYDTTLRDGGQKPGVHYQLHHKHTVASWLDDLGIAYVEGGWPGANPTDTDFFAAPPRLTQARLTAFGMTVRAGQTPATDQALQTVITAPCAAVCLVGKCWDHQVRTALHVGLDDNLDMIRVSVAAARAAGKEVLFDAEHFFDGFKSNPAYALSCLHEASAAGASWLVLCDTNGGTLPHDVESAVRCVRAQGPKAQIGFHGHNDTEHAVANSIAAVRAGCRMVQGTLAGWGERCGNANLLTLIPVLKQKLGFDVGISDEKLRQLTRLSNDFHDLIGCTAPPHAPFVGRDAFAHKGGLHASAIAKDPCTYEHTPPESVGNARWFPMSNQSGLAHVRLKLGALGIDTTARQAALPSLLSTIKNREAHGYSYDKADASFALLALAHLGVYQTPFVVEHFVCMDQGGAHSAGQARATIKIRAGDAVLTARRSGTGPVHALDLALRAALVKTYPALSDLRLTHFNVTIPQGQSGTEAVTRVCIETTDAATKTSWTSIGVSAHITRAALDALCDAYAYQLFKWEQRNDARPRDYSGPSATGRKYRHDGAGDGELCVDRITDCAAARSVAAWPRASTADGSGIKRRG